MEKGHQRLSSFVPHRRAGHVLHLHKQRALEQTIVANAFVSPL